MLDDILHSNKSRFSLNESKLRGRNFITSN